MGKVTFTPNVPQQIALKYPQGKLISGRWGEQMLFTLVDGRQMYVPMDVASKISMLEVNVNEPFCICKRWSGQKSQPARWDVWLTPLAEKDRAVEESQSAETPLERQLRDSLEQMRKPGTLTVARVLEGGSEEEKGEANPCANQENASPKVNGNGSQNGNVTADGKLSTNGNGAGNGNSGTMSEPPAMVRFSWAPFLLSQTQALTDIYAAAVDYASKRHGNHIKPEDVRALMTTAFINLAQRGGLRT